MKSVSLSFSLILASLSSLLLPSGLKAGTFGWRGDGTGNFPEATPPLVWSENDNLIWKTRLPSWSNAAPIVSGDHVFVTAEPNQLIALSRRTGDILWTRTLTYTDVLPEEEAAPIRDKIKELAPEIERADNLRGKILRLQRRMRKDNTGSKQLNTLLANAQKEYEEVEANLVDVRDYLPPPVHSADGYASATPITDGEHVYVVFGTGLAAAYDFEGKAIWKRLLERPRGREGYRSSPTLAGDKLVIAINRNIRGLDPATGESAWRARAPEAPGSVIAASKDQKAAVASPSGYLIDTLTGSRYTDKMLKLGDNAPLYHDGVLFYLQRDGMAYKLPTEWSLKSFEDLAASWKMELPTGEYLASPLLVDKHLYLVSKTGVLSILNASTGTITDTKELDLKSGTEFTASPISAGGMIFLMSDDGLTRVVKPGPTYDEVGRNPLEATRSAPVAIGDRLFIRGQRYLFCLGVK